MDHMVWMISCLRRRSMVSRRGSNFLRDDSRARNCAADMFNSSPDASAAVIVDDDRGRGIDITGDDDGDGDGNGAVNDDADDGVDGAVKGLASLRSYFIFN